MNTPSFAFNALHQIEMTSRCNLRCRYCVHPHMPRPKMDMELDVFLACLEWAKYFVRSGTQRELNLAGIGESTMHPNFVEWMFLAREAVGEHCELILATNGLLMTDELARAIAPARPRVWVSLHRPEKAGPAVEALKSAGILSGVSADPSVAAMNWAGKVKWHVSAPKDRECFWVRGGRAFVLADGRVSRCCLDGEGMGILVQDIRDADLTSTRTSPWTLCATCDQKLNIPGYEQRSAA